MKKLVVLFSRNHVCALAVFFQLSLLPAGVDKGVNTGKDMTFANYFKHVKYLLDIFIHRENPSVRGLPRVPERRFPPDVLHRDSPSLRGPFPH